MDKLNLPWIARDHIRLDDDGTGVGTYDIYNSQNKVIAGVQPYGGEDFLDIEEARQAGRFILLACNNHDRLVKCLERLFDAVPPIIDYDGEVFEGAGDAWDEAEAALKAAKGE